MTPDQIAEALVDRVKSVEQGMLLGDLKQPVVALLTRLVVNPALLDAYCSALTNVRKRVRPDPHVIADMDSGDIPDQEIAQRGFGWLSDYQLVDYATHPAAIEAIADRLRDEDLLEVLGDWYIEAGVWEQAAHPENAEEAKRFALFAKSSELDSSVSGHKHHIPPLRSLASKEPSNDRSEMPTPRSLLDRLVTLKLAPDLPDRAKDAWAALYSAAMLGKFQTIEDKDIVREYGIPIAQADDVFQSLERMGMGKKIDRLFSTLQFDISTFQTTLADRYYLEVEACIRLLSRPKSARDFSEVQRLHTLFETLAGSQGDEARVGCLIIDLLIHLELLVQGDEIDGVFPLLKSFALINCNQTGDHRPEVVREHSSIIKALINGDKARMREAYLAHFKLSERHFLLPGGVIRLGGKEDAMWQQINAQFRSLNNGLYVFQALNVRPLEFNEQGWELLKEGICAAVRNNAILCFLFGSEAYLRAWAKWIGIQWDEYEAFHEGLKSDFQQFLARLDEDKTVERTPEQVRLQVQLHYFDSRLVAFHTPQVRLDYFDSRLGAFQTPNEAYALFQSTDNPRRLTRRSVQDEGLASTEITIFPPGTSTTRTFYTEIEEELARLFDDPRITADSKEGIGRIRDRLKTPPVKGPAFAT